MTRLKGCLLIVVGLLIVYMYGKHNGGLQSNGLPTLAVLPSITWTPEAVVIQPTATEPPGVTIIPTVVVNRSGFITITPAPGTIYPTATITDTPQPSATNTDAPTETPAPQLTPMDLDIYYVVSTVNLRSCPRTDCPVVEQIAQGLPLAVSGIIQGQEVNAGNPNWYKVEHSAASEEYAYSRFLSTSPTVKAQSVIPTQPIVIQQPVSPIPQTGFTCPKNCTAARAMGLSPQQAATCPGLDRDGDGQACYDDQ